MHAIRFAAQWRGWLPGAHEPYHEDQFVAELGVAWEVEMFGARVNGGFPNPEEAHILTMTDWPTWSDSREAKTLWNRMSKFRLSAEDSGTPERTAVAPCGCSSSFVREHFFVSMVYIRTVQQQSFWDAYTGWSLHIPRTVGTDFALTKAPVGPNDMSIRLTTQEILDIFLEWLGRRHELVQRVIFYRKDFPRTLSDTALSNQQLGLERRDPGTDLSNRLPSNLLELDSMLRAHWRFKMGEARFQYPVRGLPDLLQLGIVLRKYLLMMSAQG